MAASPRLGQGASPRVVCWPQAGKVWGPGLTPSSKASARQDEPRDKSGCISQNTCFMKTGSEREDSITKRYSLLIKHSFTEGS